MKKSLLALSAAAFALTGMAANPMQMRESSRVSLDRSQPLQTNIEHLMVRPSSASTVKKAPAKVSSEDVITEVNGQVQAMTSTASGYYAYWFWIMQYEGQSAASEVVYGEDNEVYLRDFMPNAATGSYVKGVKDGDKIEVPMGQVVMFDDDYGYGMQLAVLDQYTEEDPETGEVYIGYEQNAEFDSVTFDVDAEGGMVLSSLGEEQILGFIYTDDFSWAGYGVWELSMAPFNEVAVTVPDDIEVAPFWIVNLGDYGYSVNWAQGYDEVYFQGISQNMPEAWVKGSLSYDEDGIATVSIPQGQYLGTYAGMYIRTMCAKMIYEDGQLVDAEIMPADYEYELVWDYEENVMKAKDPEVAFIYNAAEDRVYYLDYFENLTMVHQDDFAGTPANPYNLFFQDTLASYGYSGFFFTVPAISTEGYVLDDNDLYYVVYVDGDEFTFEPEEYDTEEAIVEVPWNTSLYYIYHLGGAQREVDFFVEGITTLGVQSVYKYDGEETRSEIVSIDLENSVDSILGGKKVASVKYYGIDGREVANPAAGIFVQRVTFEDGSVATFKKAVR